MYMKDEGAMSIVLEFPFALVLTNYIITAAGGRIA
jgi:hypothetical protein